MSVLVTSSFAIVRAGINKQRHRNAKALQSVRDIMKSHGANEDTDENTKPILGSNSSSGVGTSVENSRATSANHSRNTSTGSSNLNNPNLTEKRPDLEIPVVNNNINEEEQLEKLLGNENV